MDNKNLIRKSIFRKELLYIFETHKVDEFERDRIEFSIFENPLERSNHIC
jgi:hypothetical protein